jgi:putative transposase
MIQSLSTAYPVKMLCETLGVSRSGYVGAQRRCPGPRQQGNLTLVGQIRQAHQTSRGTYGSPRVTWELKAQGIGCNEKRVARLMRQEGLRGQIKQRYRPRTTDSRHDQPVAPNRLPSWPVQRMANRIAWVGDITYIDTKEGWLYLAALMDLEVRKIVGWAAEAHMREDLVQAALTKAMRQRPQGVAVLHHSDRGSQYAAAGYRACLAHANITPSMSAAGYCYDNAAMESFWATLKRECFGDYVPQTREEARLMIFDYIEVFYNRQRRHSSLGYLSPMDYETNLRYMKN